MGALGSGNRTDDRLWGSDPWRRIAAAVLARAVKDVTNCSGEKAALASVWLQSEWAEPYLDALRLAPSVVREFIADAGV